MSVGGSVFEREGIAGCTVQPIARLRNIAFDRFSYTHCHVNYLIAGSVIVDNIIMGTNSSQILPTAEEQVRPLAKLEPPQQQEVWLKAVEQAGGKVPTGKIIEDVVQSIMERTKVPNTYQLGEVC